MSMRATRTVSGTFVAIIPFVIVGAMSASGEQAPRVAGSSSMVAWEHIRLIGQKLGIPRSLVVGVPPMHALAITDVDRDGDADLVVGYADSSEVAVLLGDASQPFASVVAAQRGEWPIEDAVADVDGVTYYAQSSAIWSNTTVRDGMTAPSPRQATGEPRALAVVADFDGDGTADLAAAPARSADLFIYGGAAPGRSRIPARIALAGAAAALAAGDFDGDGMIDLAVSDGRSPAVTLLFGQLRGGFAKPQSVHIGITPARSALAAGDVNGDGKTDLVALSDNLRTVHVLLGNGDRGLTPFADAAVDVPTAAGAGEADARYDTEISSSDSEDYQGVASLVLEPATIAGGSGGTSRGTVTLNAPAPAGGVVVRLNSSNVELAASVPAITIPAGATTGSFTIGTNKNYRRYSGLAFRVTMTATHSTTSRSAVLAVDAQPRPGPLSSFDAHTEGLTCFGVGVRQTQTGITLEFGSAGNLFECQRPTDPTGRDGTCTFRQECTFGCEFRPVEDGSRFRDVCASTGPFPLSVKPRLLVGGKPSTAALQLSAPAPVNSSGILSSHTVLANTIPNLTFPIPSGATTATADVLTARVNSPQFAPIDGSYSAPRSDGSRGGRGGLTWLALVPGTPPPFRLTSLILEPASVVGGSVTFAFAQMNQVAPAPDLATATVTMSSSDPSVASIPRPEVSVTEGSSSVGIGIQTHAVPVDTVVRLTASIGSVASTADLLVKASPTATAVRSFFLDPLSVIAGDSSAGTVVLNGAAPPDGAIVTLQSSDTAAATMPASVTVPAGADRTNVTISTGAVSSRTTVTLTARYNGTFSATSLIVSPAADAPTLASIALKPTSIVGGSSSAGTVTLSGAAPADGAVVTLASSNPQIASVPASVTVPGGAISASFAVNTTRVSTTTTVTVTGSYGATQSAALTVTAATTGPLPAPAMLSPADDARFRPGESITFDWADVAGASSYTIQIDDSETFASPFVVNQTLSESRYTNGSLPTRRMWWRVRANDAAGNPGAWSAMRRFEVKD